MSCFQVQKANLVLRSTDLILNDGVSNGKGILNADRTRMTWKNINMRELLGDMYDKYDLFNLKLECVSLGSIALNAGVPFYSFGDIREDRIVTIEMEGLQFINNTYNFLQGVNNGTAVLGVYHFDYNQPCTYYNESNGLVTFSKVNNMCDLTITYKTINDNELPTTLEGNTYPRMIFMFSIYGIERERKPQRLINMSM